MLVAFINFEMGYLPIAFISTIGYCPGPGILCTAPKFFFSPFPYKENFKASCPNGLRYLYAPGPGTHASLYFSHSLYTYQ